LRNRRIGTLRFREFSDHPREELPDVKADRRRRFYAVQWVELGHEPQVGKLDVGGSEFRLRRRNSEGSAHLRIGYGELIRVRIGRASSEKLKGQPVLLLERHGQAPLRIRTLDGPGTLFELADIFTTLASEFNLRAGG
jgi:hypothetical protein